MNVSEAAPPIPASVTDVLAGRRPEPVLIGESGASVLRCTSPRLSTVYVKILRRGEAETLADEMRRLRWMANHALPVPAVLHHESGERFEYLVLGEVAGVDASAATSGAESARSLLVALANGLRLLHRTPIGDCPFDQRAAVRIEAARERVRAGLVRDDQFDEERQGRRAMDLLDELDALRPDDEQRAFTHGDYCLPNIILHDRGPARGEERFALAGFVDCALAGIADPYQDLALAVRSVRRNLGPAWVPVLREAYGLIEPDERKLRFYTLLDEFF